MARIHASAFTAERAWSKEEFAQLLGSYGVEAFREENGFALTRQVVDEVELLTIAVHAERQGTGIGHRLMTRWMDHAVDCGATTAFLEVASDNRPALQLYQSHGFAVSGQRKAYYQRPGAAAADALLMKAPLTHGQPLDSPPAR